MKRAEDGSFNLNIVQGEQRVSEDPSECVSTLLGSCVAACLHDPVARVGGMNHFLLPGGEGDRSHAERFSVHAMELLVNALLARGASRSRLEAKLFGGASTMHGLSDIGAMNAGFAVRFLAREGIGLGSSCLGGDRGRRIQFWPVSGRARRRFMAATEALPPQRAAPPPPASGALELF
ncbi:chemotaxis protein CheD [Lichenibacterium minor]|uniref:Probable chemoreceptor glutamine deamidase CheD n=1 Tax=Lichenibacterium minor TaxID=2316528 RepID=A0A4Q2U3Z6_9HYPH|nr:chemotaxis protein CheD [Lichenibacterium minor]RYC31243.1 chemotaxis protein CheD [Lichenibacterium minor]